MARFSLKPVCSSHYLLYRPVAKVSSGRADRAIPPKTLAGRWHQPFHQMLCLPDHLALHWRRPWLECTGAPISSRAHSTQHHAQVGIYGPTAVIPLTIFRGNVGTSTAFFLEAIKACRLRAKIFGKLKLDFPQRRLVDSCTLAFSVTANVSASFLSFDE